MIDAGAIRVADAVMYEGAFLYPYRRSSIKNRHRWTFGVLPPRGAADPVTRLGLTAACLLRGQSHATIEVLLRFLSDDGRQVSAREVSSVAAAGVQRAPFECDGLQGALVLERCALGEGYERVRVCVQNCTVLPAAGPVGREAERERSLHGVHLLLHVDGAAHFISLTEPPLEAEPYAALCEGQGLWCAVMGSDRARPDTALAAPLILPDFAQVAPESCTDLGDSTEIDEILALRIRTLSEAEQREARATDPWVRELLDRVEALDEQQLLRLHGTRSDQYRELRGARVTLRPRRSADGMDLLLSGRTAIVCHVERSVDGEVLLGVTLVDDPGSDLGVRGMPGHRFYFGLDEVVRLE